MQADALAAVLDEMATKHDITLLRTELIGEMATLKAEMVGQRDSLRSEMAAGHNAIRSEIATLKADLTWRFVALVVFLATVMTLIGVFVN